MKLFLRGRPIVLHAPNDIKESFDIGKVQPAPNKKLKLDWVYGYRGKDCRSNLYQLPTGEMAYFVAAVVVLYNVDEQSQRHYIGHTDDVKRYFFFCCAFSFFPFSFDNKQNYYVSFGSLSIHPNKLLVATGQCAGHDRSDAMVRKS